MAEAPEGPKDQGLSPLFDLVTRHVPSPRVAEGPFRMIGTILEADPFWDELLQAVFIPVL